MSPAGGPLFRQRSLLRRFRGLPFAVALGVLVAQRSARATLAHDVEVVTTAWTPAERVEVQRPRLLGRGERLPIPLPAWASVPSARGCTNLVILASPSVGFFVQLGNWTDQEPEQSRVGWVQVTRCGRRRVELRRIWVEMRSPRGLIETIVARSAEPLPTPAALLAHRDPGPESALGQTGPAPTAPPLEARSQAWESRAKSDGALVVERKLVRVPTRRRPAAILELREGCHRLSALALQTDELESPPDLDLVLRMRPGDVVRGDQSENSDAEIEVCVGTPSRVEVLIPGLAPGGPTMLEHAEFPLPTGLPVHFGPDVQARFAGAFFRRRQPGPRSLPIIESLGIAGRTVLPLELETRTCYVAGAVVVQGKPKSLLIDATLADRDGASDGTGDEPSVVIAFCTGDEAWVQLRVEVGGPAVTWLASVWRTGRAELREELP